MQTLLRSRFAGWCTVIVVCRWKRGGNAHDCILDRRFRPDVQLANTEEIENGKSNGALGEVFIRCNNVLYIG